MTNFWAGLFQINSSSVKACQRGCCQEETGDILSISLIANLKILCSLLTVSINCNLRLAFKVQLGSQAKMPPLWRVLAGWLMQRHFTNNFSGQGITHTKKGKESQCQGLLPPVYGGINNSIQSIWMCHNLAYIECHAILLPNWLKFHHGCSSWIWGSTDIAIVYES